LTTFVTPGAKSVDHTMKSKHPQVDEACKFQKQDAAFSEKLLAAIKEGRESCPIGISREPGTKGRILANGGKEA
jgi:hypothetical protein